MKRLYVLGSVFVAAAVLAACGGGGSAPSPLPSTPPSIVYSSRIVFVGKMAGSTVQDDLRRAQSAEPMAAGTPIPVMVVEPPESGIDSSVYGGEVQAVVSPAPSVQPSVSFTQTNTDATIVATPTGSPVPLPTGVVGVVEVKGTNVVQGQSAGTATAQIGAPVNESPTTAVYSYMSIALDCQDGYGAGIAQGSLFPYNRHFGWQWSGSVWVADDDVSTADVYLDGPNCTSVNASEAGPTVHIPGGDVRISTDTPFSSITASQFSPAETSYDPNATGLINPDGSVQCLVIGQTRDHLHTFKWFAANAACQYGAIETSGPGSADGF